MAVGARIVGLSVRRDVFCFATKEVSIPGQCVERVTYGIKSTRIGVGRLLDLLFVQIEVFATVI